ncbi:hypothetical protein CcaverHIS002_0502240 [Cutaneotrichosporon cavernicola]|uniref:DUF7330 domain-containing protein n=1 Tax=Cutaneotrichosporon cavernicola TaxID=279322 RepID=A0AA48QWM9_9TREE|nr:uncharacterized protein CcaverHIS019_0502820 [Cutaneotrichosporon cavernicola]BEI84823.1 hypothetical protein CcaverHIS002_0502240 [Cutaneotrichosporon cavernicola]BEI92654.1 hypothetical protein CcaverHIS019_0502820 [Cutaneotrichosporon cavernicola]BEJ00429.1 hypothetical protein CcaverHIS631_0502860 [Cutaneotrichosporon cavernicola]BEJ08198.1 hypothetical protein CcaverHIS641_0502830 [Cutaneotrichosporon cavernicola]
MTRTSEDLPPTYEESELESPPPVSPPPVSPPSSATKAVAPLTLTETNSSIKGTYAVSLTGSNSGPDVKMHSTNGSVIASLWLHGSIDRPAEVEITTTNGRVDLTVQRPAGIAIDVQARSLNGSVTLSLPDDFDGLVTMRSTNGRKRLVGMDGVILPNEGHDKSITYRVRPRSDGRSGPSVGSGHPRTGDDKSHLNKEEQEYARFREAPKNREDDPNDKGPDRVSASSDNGGVRVQYIGHEGEGGGGGSGSSSCCIM